MTHRFRRSTSAVSPAPCDPRSPIRGRQRRGLVALISSVLGLTGCIGVYGMSKGSGSANDTSGAARDADKNWAVEGNPLVETQGAFFTGTYRNVFVELGKDPAQVEQKLDSAYTTYFSATDENRLYYEFSADEAYVKDIAHDDIRSEGQSYAMMIALQRGDKVTFDKLWKFAHARMRVKDPKHPNYRGYAWALSTDGEMCDENSAPDGEEYFAMALYFAHHRWGSSSADQSHANYKYWADDLVDMMKNRPSISGPRARRIVTSDGSACVGKKIVDHVTSVPLFDAEQKQIRFNATQDEDWTDPSYHLPAFYNLFALWGPTADAEFWNSAAATSRSFLTRAMHPDTGLTAEYTNYDGTPHRVSWNSNSGRFAYDSWRVGGNVGMDWAWMMQPDAEPLRARADTLISFFHGQGVSDYLSIFEVDGTKETGHHSPGLVAMNAVATLATTEAVSEQSKAVIEDLWNTALPTGKYRYYDGLLYTFALLHLSGQYRIYAPEASPVADQAPTPDASAPEVSPQSEKTEL